MSTNDTEDTQKVVNVNEFEEALEAILSKNKHNFWYLDNETNHKKYGLVRDFSYYPNGSITSSASEFKKSHPEMFERTFQKIFNKFEKEDLHEQIENVNKSVELMKEKRETYVKKRKQLSNKNSIQSNAKWITIIERDIDNLMAKKAKMQERISEI
jgi:hypothetical protein